MLLYLYSKHLQTNCAIELCVTGSHTYIYNSNCCHFAERDKLCLLNKHQLNCWLPQRAFAFLLLPSPTRWALLSTPIYDSVRSIAWFVTRFLYFLSPTRILFACPWAFFLLLQFFAFVSFYIFFTLLAPCIICHYTKPLHAFRVSFSKIRWFCHASLLFFDLLFVGLLLCTFATANCLLPAAS